MCLTRRARTPAACSMAMSLPGLASVTDGTSNTIMVSEDAGRPDLYLNGRLIAVGSVIPGYHGR